MARWWLSKVLNCPIYDCLKCCTVRHGFDIKKYECCLDKFMGKR